MEALTKDELSMLDAAIAFYLEEFFDQVSSKNASKRQWEDLHAKVQGELRRRYVEAHK